MIEKINDRFSVDINPGEYSMDFKLVETEVGGDSSEVISGHLKWDGCMNWSTSEPIMYHFCGPEDAVQLTECFKKIYELGQKHVGRWMLKSE